jgi:hypothetical protein
VVQGAKGQPAKSTEQTKQALAMLITEAHRVSAELAAAAAGPAPVRRPLQAAMLKETAFALARNYTATGETNAAEFRKVAMEMLDAGGALVPEEALHMFGETGPDYGDPHGEDQRAQDRLRAVQVEIVWDIHRALVDPRLHVGRFFSMATDSSDAEQPFTYGRPLSEVRMRLVEGVRRIVDGARPDISTAALMARWEEGALSRASNLLCSLYCSETTGLLRQEATADLLARARVNSLGRTFEAVIATAERKAAAHFNEIERSAPELMRLGERTNEVPQESPRVIERERS